MTALESVCSLCFIVGMVGGVFEVVNTVFVGDILDRAAHAVATDNALQDRPAETEEELRARAWTAIRAELGDRLNPDLVDVVIDVYDDPSAMMRSELSQGENSRLGGDAGDMVVVRVRFRPEAPLPWMRQKVLPDDFAFQALAVARNERMVELND